MDLKNIKRTPVLLLTGYLGSGKTTLVNHILNNKKGIRFAVIVNDIGEVNIDADLIQKGGVVGQKDESLVALQNGCICCTLKMDLVEQLQDILRLERFDYIVIEASGICEPEPIARTICSIPQMGEEYLEHGIAMLDCVTTVVDAWRMQAEFDCGQGLYRRDLDEEDIENLLIQQIEFCNMVMLNKVSKVTSSELERLRQIVHQLNPTAKIVECDYAQCDLSELICTGLFHYGKVSGSAGWIQHIERTTTDEEDYEAKYGAFLHNDKEEDHDHHHHDEDHADHHHDDEEENHEHHHHDDEEGELEHHHHHHHHHHEEGEAEEYGIGTFVYYRRQAFDIDKFDRFVNLHWPKNVIRAKGVCYFSYDIDMSYLFEQAGKQIELREAGQWYATMPDDQLYDMMRREPMLAHDWDEDYGDRMAKIVFIGQHLDKQEITRRLDECIAK